MEQPSIHPSPYITSLHQTMLSPIQSQEDPAVQSQSHPVIHLPTHTSIPPSLPPLSPYTTFIHQPFFSIHHVHPSPGQTHPLIHTSIHSFTRRSSHRGTHPSTHLSCQCKPQASQESLTFCLLQKNSRAILLWQRPLEAHSGAGGLGQAVFLLEISCDCDGLLHSASIAP